MSVLTVKPEWVTPFNPDHLTPQGIDLCIGGVYTMTGRGFLYKNTKELPDYYPVKQVPTWHATHTEEGVNGWYLEQGFYLIEFVEEVAIPLNAMATMHPRSSLLRMGATLNTAVWDAGYRGVSKTTLTISNPSGIFIEEGTRVGHMMFFRLEEVSEGYSGQYQGEKPVEKG